MREESRPSTRGECLAVENLDEDVLHPAMDGLPGRQAGIETALAQRHLGAGTLALYDLTAAYFEGRHGPLAR